ncbi:hypothetical protein OSTOST_12827 [Ostertagia ostertagi]
MFELHFGIGRFAAVAVIVDQLLDVVHDAHDGHAQQAEPERHALLRIGRHAHGAEDHQHGEDGEIRQIGEQPHAHLDAFGTFAFQAAAQAQLRYRNEQVDEQDQNAVGVHDEGEDQVGRHIRDGNGEIGEQGAEQDGADRHAVLAQLDQARGGVAAARQRKDHARRGVQAGVQRRQHGRQNDGVHDVGRVRNVHDGQGADEGRGDGRRIPGHDADDDKHGTHIKHQHARDDGIGGAGDGLGRVRRFSGGDGDDFGARIKGRGGHGAAEYRPPAVRHEAAMAGQKAQAWDAVRQAAREEQGADEQEDDDGDHLDRSEPELEFAESFHRKQVQHRHRHEQDQADGPRWHIGQPEVDQLGAGDGFQGDDDDPEIPVHPAAHEAEEFRHLRLVVEGQARIFVKGADHGQGRGQLAQHAHDQDDQAAREQEG